MPIDVSTDFDNGITGQAGNATSLLMSVRRSEFGIYHRMELMTCMSVILANWLRVGDFNMPCSAFSDRSGSRCPCKHHLPLTRKESQLFGSTSAPSSSGLWVSASRLPINRSGWSRLIWAPAVVNAHGILLGEDCLPFCPLAVIDHFPQLRWVIAVAQLLGHFFRFMYSATNTLWVSCCR